MKLSSYMLIVLIALTTSGCGSSRSQSDWKLKTEYDENGQKTSEGYVRNGKKVGMWVEWDTWISVEKTVEGNYKNGKRHGNWIWFESEQKKYEVEYKNDKRCGKSIDWYNNGQKKLEGKYVSNKRRGKWTEWYRNGQKKSEGNYKDTFEWQDNNIDTGKVGVWTYWNEQGIKTKTEKYDGKGYLIKTIEYKDGTVDAISISRANAKKTSTLKPDFIKACDEYKRTKIGSSRKYDILSFLFDEKVSQQFIGLYVYDVIKLLGKPDEMDRYSLCYTGEGFVSDDTTGYGLTLNEKGIVTGFWFGD